MDARRCHSVVTLEPRLVLRRFKPQAFDHRKMLFVPADERAILLDRCGGDQRVECAQAI